MPAKASKWRSRHRILLGSATTAATAALIAVGVPALALSTHPASTAGSTTGSGYPPPGGIYTGFTNCPVKNPLMHESTTLTVCVLGDATSGSITLGDITTPVTAPVNVQFGFYQNTQQPYYADVVPPPEGLSAQLATKPDLIPGSLTTALGCATATNAAIVKMCQTAQARGGVYNRVYALAESDGAITNFNLFDWTQPVKFRLINPLLGNGCSIGTFGHPVVLNPQLSVAPGGGLTETPDPNPAKHPDTAVIGITKASASDSTFSAPGVSNCGPGGVADLPVQAALDSWAGLPAASGNSLTLSGSFQLADTFAAQDTPGTDNAAILLNALTYSRRNVQAQTISMAELEQLLNK